MNDGLRTDIFLRYRPETIACACIHLAARTIAVSLSGLLHFQCAAFYHENTVSACNSDISRNLCLFLVSPFLGLKRLMQVIGMYRRSQFCFCKSIPEYG